MTKLIVKTLNELDPQSREYAVSNLLNIFDRDFYKLFRYTDISCREMVESIVSKSTLQFTCSGEVVLDAASLINTRELIHTATTLAEFDETRLLRFMKGD